MFCFLTSDMSQGLQKNAVSDSIFHVMLSFFWNKKISSTYELGTLTHYQQKQTIPNVWIKRRKKKIPQCSCFWQAAENNLLIICVYSLTSWRAIKTVFLQPMWTVIFFFLLYNLKKHIQNRIILLCYSRVYVPARGKKKKKTIQMMISIKRTEKIYVTEV